MRLTSIRTESAQHHASVRELTVKAFTESEFGHNGEADLIETLRVSCGDALSLVAITDDIVVGHVLFTPATIRTQNDTVSGMALAPIAVLPQYQKRGIGSLLVREGLRRIDEASSAFTAVVGHLQYYPRFGFRGAKQSSIEHGFDGIPQDLLMIRFLDLEIAAGLGDGRLFYHEAFGDQYS